MIEPIGFKSCIYFLHSFRNTVFNHTMLIRLGFIAIVEDLGLDILADVRLFTDDEIENLCKVIRRPGGTLLASGRKCCPCP